MSCTSPHATQRTSSVFTEGLKSPVSVQHLKHEGHKQLITANAAGDNLLVLRRNTRIWGPLGNSVQWDAPFVASNVHTCQALSENMTNTLVLGWFSKHTREGGGIAFALFQAWKYEGSRDITHLRPHGINSGFGTRSRKTMVHV